MKRTLSLILTICAVLSLASCAVTPKTPQGTGEGTLESTETGYITPDIPDGHPTHVPDVVPPTNIVIEEHYINVLPETEVTGAYEYHNVSGDTSTVNAVSQNGAVIFGDNEMYLRLYVNGEYKNYKYDLKTGEYTSACTDPACMHTASDKCIGVAFPDQANDGNQNLLQFVSGDSMYFSVNGCVYEYNGKTSKIQKITDYDGVIKSYNTCSAIEYGDYIYTVQNILIKGADPMKFESYSSGVFRTSKKGGKTELVKDLGSRQSILRYIENDKMYFCKNDFTVFTTDLEGNNEEELFEIYWLWDFSVKSDKVIYSVISELDEETRGFKACNIYTYDTLTGKHQKISDDRVLYYFVTDNYIYYMPRPDGKNYWSLMRIKHDGSDKTELMKITNAGDWGFGGRQCFCVIGDYFFTIRNKMGSSGALDTDYVCYDFVNSTYTVIGSGKWYKMNWEELPETEEPSK